jgi:ATP-dependent DNA ligase
VDTTASQQKTINTGMQYSAFNYIFPPRSTIKINPENIDKYDDGNFVGQVKYNGSNSPVFLDGQGDCKIYNRHGEAVSASKFPKTTIDFRGIHSGSGYMVVAGELMNKAQAGEDGDKLEGYVIWDILVYNGKYLIGSTIQERLDLLENLFPMCRMKVCNGELKQFEHLSFTNVEGVYRAPVYTRYFSQLYEDIVCVPAYEGLVLKKLNAKLDFGYSETNNNAWQVKVRKQHKNYQF